MKTTAPDPNYPRVYVDFNAWGWDGPDDPCYYIYVKEHFQKFVPTEGMILCIYMESDEFQVVGCLAQLERDKKDWRFRPFDDSWFEVSNEFLNPSSTSVNDGKNDQS